MKYNDLRSFNLSSPSALDKPAIQILLFRYPNALLIAGCWEGPFIFGMRGPKKFFIFVYSFDADIKIALKLGEYDGKVSYL